jgi:hypothetical protein
VTPLFPILLVLHVALAVGLLLPSVALPFLLRDAAPAGPRGAATSWLVRLQSDGAVPIALGVAATGVALLVLLGVELLQRGWLLAALVLYAVNLVIAVAVARPELRSLLGGRVGDEAGWRERARRARWIAYGMAALIGVIGLLMMTKPSIG